VNKIIIFLIATCYLFSQEPQKLWEKHYATFDVEFSNDGSMLAVAHNENCLLLDPYTGEPIHALSHEKEGFYSVVFSYDGEFLITGGADSVLTFWDLNTQEIIKEYNFGQVFGEWEFTMYEMQLTSDDKTLVIAGGSAGLIVMNLEEMTYRVKNENIITSSHPNGSKGYSSTDFVSLSHDSRYVMINTSVLNEVTIYDLETLEEVKKYEDALRGQFHPNKDEFFIADKFRRTTYIYKSDFENWNDKIETLGDPLYSDLGYFLVFNHGIKIFKTSNLEQVYAFTENNDGLNWNGGGQLYCYNETRNLIAFGGRHCYFLGNTLSVESSLNREDFDLNINSNLLFINYKFNNPTEFSLYITDLVGDNTSILDDGFGDGNYEKQFDISSISSGKYFVTLFVNGKNLTKQFIKE
jgi:WD40 repeat protein